MKPRTVTKLKTSGQLRHRSVVSPLISTDKVARHTSGGKEITSQQDATQLGATQIDVFR